MGTKGKPDRKPAVRRRRLAKLESSEAKPGIQRDQTEQLLKDLFINSPIGLYIVQDGCFRLVSPAFQRTLGYSEDELIGAPSLQFVFPDDRDVVRENAVKMLRGQRFSPYEFRFVTKGGEVRWVTEAVIPLHYLGKRAALGSFVDITERKQAEATLQASEQNFRNSLDASPYGVLVVDAKWNMLYANPALLDIYGVSSLEELKTTPSKKRIAAESYPGYLERREKAKRGGPLPTHYEMSIIRKDGIMRYLNFRTHDIGGLLASPP